jgi:hypothetical protein
MKCSKNKQLKCPSCGKKAIEYIHNGKIIIKCAGRNPCFYYNEREIN